MVGARARHLLDHRVHLREVDELLVLGEDLGLEVAVVTLRSILLRHVLEHLVATARRYRVTSCK